MAKTYSILVGRDEKVLRYTMDERRAIEKAFGASLLTIMKKRAFEETVSGGWTPVGGEWDVQVELLFQGLKHLGPAISRKKVEWWMNDSIESDPSGVLPYLVAMSNAILASGILGARYETPEQSEVEGEAGKETAPAPESGAGS